MGRLRSSTPATLSKRSTSRPPARSGASVTKRSLAGRGVVLEDQEGKKHTYKLQGSVDTFIYFVIERHKIFELRFAGEPGPWTDDPILQKARFTNDFRMLDYDTQYEARVVIPEGSTNFRERVFRVLLFRLFDRIETYEFLRETFGVPSWKEFNRRAYTKALDQRKKDGFSLVGHAYQMPAPTTQKIGGTTHHDRLLRLLDLMMHSKLPDALNECNELCDMQAVIALYPTMDNFLGYQVILDLNMIPQLMLPEDWALPGPGAQSGLHMIFGAQLRSNHVGLAMQWIHEHFDELVIAAGFSRKDIPALKLSEPGLSMVDVEHVLCEFSKYAKIASPKKYRYRAYELESSRKVTRVLPKNWKSARVAFLERNRKYTNPDADKNGEYEPAAILGKEPIDGKLHYKVRWRGWGPDADTWEPTSELTKQAPDVVEAYEKKISEIDALLTKYRAGRM